MLNFIVATIFEGFDMHRYTAWLLLYRIVPIKEPSVIIAASSEHRKEAIDAVSFAIDALKSSTTIWKKVNNSLLTDRHGRNDSLQELYAEGSGEWKENKECIWLPENQQ